jgi:tyrosyl-tRNA synthetase
MKNDEILTRAVSDIVPRKLAEAKLSSGKPIRIYLGIDPTGTKLHLGHSVPLRKLRAFQDAGHHIIFLVGSFTGMIGDPTGRDAERIPLTMKEIEQNFADYQAQASLILDWKKTKVLFNHDWLAKLTMEELVQILSHFTKQQLEQRDMFQKREKDGQAIHMHEMLYPVFQGYDSVAMDVDAELGGNDQLFNMLAGRTLMHAMKGKEKFVLTTKIIDGTDGRKMSKTYNNCVYLTDEPNDMYGKLMSISDELIVTYMECCTDIPMGEVAAVEKALKAGKENPKTHKMRLAREIVKLYHGDAAARSAEEHFQNVFAHNGVPDDMPEYKPKKGESLIDALQASGMVTSKSEARRLIDQGGIKVNDTPVTSIEEPAKAGVVKVGKRKFVRFL